uniref:Nodulin-like domain-containing protein n=1 Tax=Quercus lobata TaxID=97700 RepID=A0A7N2R6X8_QUELO
MTIDHKQNPQIPSAKPTKPLAKIHPQTQNKQPQTTGFNKFKNPAKPTTKKWIATVASKWILCSCGANTFSIYSSVLKSSQGYDNQRSTQWHSSRTLAATLGFSLGSSTSP